MPPFDHFKLLAPIYEIFIKPKQPEELMARMDLPAEGALLDAGGGTGCSALGEETTTTRPRPLPCRRSPKAFAR